jgi:dienelactone hydrolase
MAKVAQRILLTPLVLLALTLAPAQGASFRFRSEVPQKKWTRTLRGELVLPHGKGPFAAVVFLHPCAGITPPVRRSLQAHARTLTRNGFAVLYFESLRTRGIGGGKSCAPPLAAQATTLLLYDAFNAKAALARSPRIDGDNIFVAGQSLGGTAALKAALKSHSLHDDAFRAAAAWYPDCRRTIAYSTELKSPLLVLGGGKDDWTPPDVCQDAKKDGRMTGADFEVIVAPHALHGFDQPRGRYRYKGHTLGYDAAATARGRKAMVAFFKAHLKK